MQLTNNTHYTRQIEELTIEAEQLFNELHHKLQTVYSINYDSILYIEDPFAEEFFRFQSDIEFRIEHILQMHGLKRNAVTLDEEFTLQPADLDVSPDMSLQEFFDRNFTGHCENASIIDAIATKSADDLFKTLSIVLSDGTISEQYIYREIERVRYFVQIIKDTIESLDSAGSKINEITDRLFDDYQRLYLDVQVD